MEIKARSPTNQVVGLSFRLLPSPNVILAQLQVDIDGVFVPNDALCYIPVRLVASFSSPLVPLAVPYLVFVQHDLHANSIHPQIRVLNNWMELWSLDRESFNPVRFFPSWYIRTTNLAMTNPTFFACPLSVYWQDNRGG